jgi:two-component system, response regulator / RNA-binding antiterminator
MASVFAGYNRSEIFEASDSPLLVVDTNLVIRDVNPAYLRATERAYDELAGTPLFEAFPDNPSDPEASGVTNVQASFERVFRHGRRDHMPLQRYDIRSADAEAAFVRKFWTPVNSPLRDETGHLIGALHHVEDVTAIAEVAEAICESGPGASLGLNVEQDAWNALVTALTQEALGHQQARQTAEQLQQALTSRILIEQAKGMIAAREGIGVDQAFIRLRQHARRHNAGLHDVARAVVQLGLSV